jgi:uncharacterized membrane protein
VSDEREVTSRLAAAQAAGAAVFPSSSSELVTALAHYYRGELSRMISWRDRIDRTTNWAIGAVAAALSVSLSSPVAHHGVLLFAMLLVFLLLVIESRRYRFFHVYRSRVRLLERSYYARLFAPRDMAHPTEWMAGLGEDLRSPRFTMTAVQAIARRLRRNYFWMFLILLLAWVLKTTPALVGPRVPGAVAPGVAGALAGAAVGAVPGGLVWLLVLGLHGWMLYVMLRHREAPGELSYGEVHM